LKTLPSLRSIDKKTVPDAIRDVIGFYPIRMTVDGDNIFVECVQKENTKLMGEVIDKKGQPIVYANISLLSAKDSTFINGGVSNLAGKFVIPCGAKHALVKISCIGYKTILRAFDADGYWQDNHDRRYASNQRGHC
jgi:hypothetical protein